MADKLATCIKKREKQFKAIPQNLATLIHSIDCHEATPLAMTVIGHHFCNFTESSNDDLPPLVFARKSARIDEAIHLDAKILENIESKKDSNHSVESSDSILSLYCHEVVLDSRNDENRTLFCDFFDFLDCHENPYG